MSGQRVSALGVVVKSRGFRVKTIIFRRWFLWKALVGLSKSIVGTVGSAISSSSALEQQQTSAQIVQDDLLTCRLELLNQKHENLEAQCAALKSQTEDLEENSGELETDQIRYTLRYWQLNTEFHRLREDQG